MRNAFRRYAQRTAEAVGSVWAFLAAIVAILGWAATGPMFGFSDTWQLVINTGTTEALGVARALQSITGMWARPDSGPPHPALNPVPLVAAVTYTAVLAVALLIPADSAWHAARQNVYLSLGGDLPWAQRLRDILVNVGAFVPAGLLWDAALAARGRRPLRRAGAVVLAALAFALAVESLQYVFAWRDSSLVDVLSDGAGAAAGVLLAATARRPRVRAAVPPSRGRPGRPAGRRSSGADTRGPHGTIREAPLAPAVRR